MTPPADGGFVQDPTAGWRRPADEEAAPKVVRLPPHVRFTAEVDGAPVWVVAVRRDGKPHLVNVYDHRGDLLPFLSLSTTAELAFQADGFLKLDENVAAAIEEGRRVGQI
jgi:hypothetical protein